MKKKVNLNFIVIYIIFSATLLISFYFNEDGSHTPLSGDFRDTWLYVLKLKENILANPQGYTPHYPLHYFLLSRINFIFTDPLHVRLVFCIISMIVPFFFFFALSEKYTEKNRNILFIICLCIFFVPTFRYSAVWANDRITTDIFILLGSYFFFKFQNSKIINTKYLYITFLFFALACYSRQFYVVYYALFLIYIFKNNSFRSFVNLAFYSLILSLPGIYLLYKLPSLFGDLAYSGNIFNTLLGNVSSLFVYILPIIIINFLFQEKNIFNFKRILIYLVVSLIIFIISYLNHNLSIMGQNGGAFFYFSSLIFGNYLAFYLIFIINFVFILTIFEKYQDRLIVFSFVFIFCSIIVTQNVFEPLFLLFFFLYSQSKFKDIFLTNSKAAATLLLYYIIYYLVAVTDVMYLIKL